MNTLEQRLRRELPELADALKYTTQHTEPLDASPAETGPSAGWHDKRRPSRILVTGIAAACVLVLIGGLVAVNQARDSDHPSSVDLTSASPAGFGGWDPLPEAPIETRPYAMSAWTGNEAVFWAGSSLSRGFAYSDGAAFNPETNSWRTLTVPGWGHPGLTSVYFQGDLYALAKGGGTRFNPTNGTWVDLPQVDNMYLAATVATDDAVWGLGPTALNRSGQPDITIARYQPETDTWENASVFEGTDDTTEIISGLSRLETQVVWSGEEILAWNGTQGGIAFNPASGQWRTVAAPTAPSGAVADGQLLATDSGLALVAKVDQADSQSIWDVAVPAGDQWNWRGDRIQIDAPETVSTIAAGDWIVLFSEQQSPVTIHLPTGEWKEHIDGPLHGLTAPNTAWTGDQLVVWGGVPTAPDDGSPQPTGAIWSPPAGG